MQQLDKEKAYWFVLGTTTVNRERWCADMGGRGAYTGAAEMLLPG